MAVNRLSDTQGYVDFFQQRLHDLLAYWRDHEAVQQLQIAVLDREREVILKVIILGLDIAPLWPIARPLIVALTPYMERRGYWDAWHEVLQKSIGVAHKLTDIDAETTLTALLARLCQRMNRPQDVVIYYRRTIRLARQTGNRFEEGRACSNLGYFYIDGSRWWRSEVLSKQALAIFEELGSDHGRAHTNNHLGILFIRRRNWTEAEFHLQAACMIWMAMQDKHGQIYGFENLALLYNETKRPQEALSYLKKTEELLTATGETSEIATVWNNMAEAYRLLGNFEKSVVYAGKAEEIYRRNMNSLDLARVWHNLGLTYREQGQISQAEYYRGEALKIYRQFNYQAGEEELLEDYGVNF